MAELRVATFNLLHGMSWSDGVTDPARLAESVRTLAPDVIGLQEVDRHQDRSGSVDQTQLVAAQLGAEHWRFVPAVHGTPGEVVTWTPAASDDGLLTEGPTYGIGLVSRFPVLRWSVRRFPPAPFRLPLLVPGAHRPQLIRIPDEPRLALAAVVDGPAGPFTAVTCHLSFVPGYNARQLRSIAHWVSRMPRPVLLFGDLNLPGPLPRRLTGWTPLVNAPTYPSSRPRVQFDHVLGLGVTAEQVLRAQALTLPVSDHCAVLVDLSLPPA